MNNGRHDHGLALHRPHHTGDDGPDYPHATNSPYFNHPTSSIPSEEENNRSSEEIEEPEIEFDGQEIQDGEDWIRETSVESFCDIASPYLGDAEDTTQAAYLLRTHSSSPRRPYLGRTHAPNPACLLDRYWVAFGAPSPLTDPDAGPGGSTRRRRPPEDVPNDRVPFAAAGQRPDIVRPVLGDGPRPSHQSPWSRRPALQGPIEQGSPPPSTSRTVQGVPISEPHVTVGNYNLRPRGSPAKFSSYGLRHPGESFSRIAGSNGLLEDTEVGPQSRKRRRAGPGRCPASASTSVPGSRSRRTSLQGKLAHSRPEGAPH